MNDKEDYQIIKKQTKYITKVGVGNKTNATRVFIPNELVKELGLEPGDYILWYIFTDAQTGEKYIAFKKQKLG
ncbi:MAG: hypothetical protein ACP5GS_03830 [Nitrososphaeria archaeon]